MSDRLRRVVRLCLRATFALSVLGAGTVVALAALAWPRVRVVLDETEALARDHADHLVAHPGWSFPATVWSAPAALEGLPPERRALHARARRYAEVCPPVEPGSFCPSTGEVAPREGSAFEPVRLGVLVGPDAEVRFHLPLDRAPEHLIAAVLVAEDASFREHHGVHLAGVLRAAWRNLLGDGAQQGASTLTMQLVRNLTGDKERTLERKLLEMARAVALERAVGKDGVLAMYLDAPYLGQAGSLSVCGFEAAARHYWGKSATDLTLAESATLAQLLPAPGRYAPDRAPEVAKERRDRLLRRMGELGWDVEAALAEPLGVGPHPLLPPERFPTYLQATRVELEARLAPEVAYGAGLDVFTGLDVVAQEQTEGMLGPRLDFLTSVVGRRGDDALGAAVALVDPVSGLLVAAHDTQQTTATDFSRVTQARRQAGSSFKPAIYALAFSPGPDGRPAHRADDAVPNEYRNFEGTNGWRPRNIAGRYAPTCTYAYGLAASMNIATASVLETCGGPPALIPFAQKLGFDTSSWPSEMGLALGQGEVTPLEMARFVGEVVGGGLSLSGSPIARVVDADGTEVLATPAPSVAALTPEAALLVRELMGLVVTQGTGGGVRWGGGFPGYPGDLVGKTGTADDEKDLWFVGGTPRWAGALWLGHDRPVRIGGSASDLAAPLFGWWLRAVNEGLPTPAFDRSGLASRWVCNQTGLHPVEGCKGVLAPLLPDQHVRGVCPGTHPLETGVSLGDHESLWDKRAKAAAAAEAEAAAAAP